MSEIEKLTAAINELSELAGIYYCDGLTDRAGTIRFAVKLLRAELEREKNPPLTLEEIKAMKGKPIFTLASNGLWSCWDVLTDVEEIGTMVILHWRGLNRSEYKTTEGSPKFYRYEPKGEKA